MKTYVLHKQDDKWILEQADVGKVEHSEHGKRINGVKSLFDRYSGLLWFTIAYPHDKETQLITHFRKEGRVWRFQQRKYPSQMAAVSGFFALHPKLNLFYIGIPDSLER